MSERITWTNSTRKLRDLIPWAINPAFIGKDEARRLEESLDQFGQVQAIAISPTNEIYDGHQRQTVWGASKKFGMDYEVDVRISSRPLTEDERKKLVIYLRKGAVGQFDFDILANNWEFDELVAWGFDEKELLGAGFEQDEPEGEDPGAQIDKAEELRQKWDVESGQLWQLGEHRLICGDCTKVEDVGRLLNDGKPDFSFTDPPYNVGIKYKEETNDNQSRDGFIEWCKGWTVHLPGRLLLTVGIKRLVWWDDILGDPQWIIAWIKKNGQGQTGLGGTNKWDAILVYGVKIDNDIDIVEVNNDYSEGIKANGGHPTAKPVELWSKMIGRFTVPGEIVYEPFSGSGTTLIACERLRRKCRAVEISPAYCAVAIQRWVDMTGGVPELIAS